MSPGPAELAPLSNKACTSGVCAANSLRAVATSGAVVKRRAGSGDLGRHRGGGRGEVVEDERVQCVGLGRDFVGHIDVEELQPATDRLGIGRVDVSSVHHVGEQRGRLRNGVDQRRPLRSGLLVLERAGEEDRDIHVRGPVDHRSPVEERGSRPGPGTGRDELWPDQSGQVLGLVVQRLIGQTGRRCPIARGEFTVDLVVGPGLSDTGDRRRRALDQLTAACRWRPPWRR